MVASLFVDEVSTFQGATVGAYIIGISSLILLTGYSGQISLGHGAFLAIGGYAATLVRLEFNSPIWLCFLAAVIASSACGAILGVSAARLSGPYLAGTTLALAIGLPSITNYFPILGGEEGLIFDVSKSWSFLGADFPLARWYLLVTTITVIISMWWVHNILSSKFGRHMKASRSHEVAAELSGIRVRQLKVIAFTLSAAVAGLSGAVLAAIYSVVSPGAFPLSLSFLLATGAVLSGITTLRGSLIGALTLIAIPEISDAIAHFLTDSDKVTANLPGFLVSVLLIMTVLFVPNGPVEQWRERHLGHTKAPTVKLDDNPKNPR